MSIALGQSVIVENRTGANGQIGTVAAARATADGYTLIYNSLNHTVNSLLMKNAGYDPIKDFTPITLALFSASVLVVGSAQPWQSLQDLVQAAKANPGGITFGSAGIGGSAHLTAELFRSQAGVNMTHVRWWMSSPARCRLFFIRWAGCTSMWRPSACGRWASPRRSATPCIRTCPP
jgi:tripartite-type tricarboxylate transporter receptor subunit TctC